MGEAATRQRTAQRVFHGIVGLFWAITQLIAGVALVVAVAFDVADGSGGSGGSGGGSTNTRPVTARPDPFLWPTPTPLEPAFPSSGLPPW